MATCDISTHLTSVTAVRRKERDQMLPDIGLIGVAGSGKDTVASILVDRYGYKRVAFADAVRDLLLKVDPYVDLYRLSMHLQIGSWDEAKREPEIRRMLQALGDGARRVIGPDVWIDGAIAKASRNAGLGSPSVFTDVRYVNEAEAVVGIGDGIIIRVDRPGAGLDGPAGQHVTEREHLLIKPWYVIENGGTLEGLILSVEGIIEELKGQSLDP